MGVYIKGMEMPKNCTVCGVERQANCIVWQGAEPSKTGRHENCPLIELPPHGDLIDKDKYEVFGYTGTEGRPNTFDDGIMFMLDRLDAAPVIVEAEGEE